MTDVADRYRKLSSQFLATVRQVPPDAWEAPSPCEGWTARDVVRHVADTSAFFTGRATGGTADAPSVDDDPVAAAEGALGAVQSALDDPASATRTYQTPMGESTLEQTVGAFGLADLLLHAWDLGKAAGLHPTLDPEESRRVLAQMEPMGDMVRRSGVFGPAVPVPADADDGARLLGFTGRDPSWASPQG